MPGYARGGKFPEPGPSPWQDVVYEGDGEVSDIWGLPTAVQKVNEFGNHMMEDASIWNPLTYPQWLAGATLEGLTDVPNKILQGEDVTMADAALFAAEVAPVGFLAGKAIKPIAGHAALAQDITRRDHAYEAVGDRASWYRGGKLDNLVTMATQAPKEFARRLIDLDADALYRKHRITQGQKEEFERAFAFNPEGRVKGKFANNNEIISNAQYMESILQKYFPNNTAFAEDFRKLLMPRTVQTTGADLAESAMPMRRLFGEFDYLEAATDNDILTHISRPIVGRPGSNPNATLMDKEVILNLKPWVGNTPLSDIRKGSGPRGRVKRGDDRMHGAQNKYNPSATALELLKDIPDGPVTFNDVLAAATKRNDEVATELVKLEKKVMDNLPRKKNGELRKGWERKFSNDLRKARTELQLNKPRISIGELYEGMQETDRFLSFDGRILGQDRLLANYNHRLIVDKETGDMFLMTYDEMRQGTGSGTLDAILNAGTPEGISVDISPIKRTGTGRLQGQPSSATANLYNQSGVASQKEQAEAVKAHMQEMFKYQATPADMAKFGAKAFTAGSLGGGVLGYVNEQRKEQD